MDFVGVTGCDVIGLSTETNAISTQKLSMEHLHLVARGMSKLSVLSIHFWENASKLVLWLCLCCVCMCFNVQVGVSSSQLCFFTLGQSLD